MKWPCLITIAATLTAGVSAQGPGQPVEIEVVDGSTIIRNHLPLDIIILAVRGDPGHADFETVRVAAQGEANVHGQAALVDLVPVTQRYTMRKEDCKTTAAGGNVRVAVLNAIEATREEINTATRKAMDSSRTAMDLKMQAAQNEYNIKLEDPTLSRRADEAIDNGNYDAANSYLSAENQRRYQAAQKLMMDAVTASMEADHTRRDIYAQEAQAMQASLNEADARIHRVKSLRDGLAREAEARADFSKVVVKEFDRLNLRDINAVSVSRPCSSDARASDVIAVTSKSAAPGKLRVRFDHGGNVEVIAFPEKDNPDKLLARIPVPAVATRAEVLAEGHSLGTVNLRSRSLDGMVSDAKDAASELRKAAKAATYRSQGGNNVDTGTSVW